MWLISAGAIKRKADSPPRVKGLLKWKLFKKKKLKVYPIEMCTSVFTVKCVNLSSWEDALFALFPVSFSYRCIMMGGYFKNSGARGSVFLTWPAVSCLFWICAPFSFPLFIYIFIYFLLKSLSLYSQEKQGRYKLRISSESLHIAFASSEEVVQ